MATYKAITISAEGSGVAVAGGELGAFTFGFDELGGSVLYGDGVEFHKLDRQSDSYTAVTAYELTYARIDSED